MIGYFPEPYPDELVYSLLARYCAKSGYLGYVCAAEEIFQNTWNLPNIEFLNEYKPEVYQRLDELIPNMPVFVGRPQLLIKYSAR